MSKADGIISRCWIGRRPNGELYQSGDRYPPGLFKKKESIRGVYAYHLDDMLTPVPVVVITREAFLEMEKKIEQLSKDDK